jgi:ribonuclease R
MDEGVETEAALYRNGIPVDFSEESLAQTEHLPTEVTTQDKQGRVDITDMKLVTIDGEDSRDFDDAVYAEPTRCDKVQLQFQRLRPYNHQEFE